VRQDLLVFVKVGCETNAQVISKRWSQRTYFARESRLFSGELPIPKENWYPVRWQLGRLQERGLLLVGDNAHGKVVIQIFHADIKFAVDQEQP
jgi:hypothetical protein